MMYNNMMRTTMGVQAGSGALARGGGGRLQRWRSGKSVDRAAATANGTRRGPTPHAAGGRPLARRLPRH